MSYKDAKRSRLEIQALSDDVYGRIAREELAKMDEKEASGNIIKHAVVGGILGGPAGAIVGGLVGSTKNAYKKKY